MLLDGLHCDLGLNSFVQGRNFFNWSVRRELLSGL